RIGRFCLVNRPGAPQRQTRRLLRQGGENRLGHIVAIIGIHLKLPSKMTLEKCREGWSFGLASYISTK
ncbi:hypothetical protein, partial [Mesorhizobium sp. M7A.F.Ca.US.003.02.1.1]|uniref:hypothetical protein n=1 Tax=Mesorhizobium sp. M7A.F.Ca.US.003.02.1.1 TaxID=2496710 RepID=UPI0019D2F6D4